MKEQDMETLHRLIREKQYGDFRRLIEKENEADVAALLEELPEEELVKIYRLLPKSMAAEVFSYLPVELEQEIITSMSYSEAADIVDSLAADDAADLLEEMPANLVKKVLANTGPETRRAVNHLLQYPEDSAGSIMTVEYVDLKRDMTVEQAIGRIRKIGVDRETINTCYVLERDRRLCGIVSIRQLLLAQPDKVISQIMEEHVIMLRTLENQEDVAKDFQKYGFYSMPVVDQEGRMVGIITVDDVVDVMEQEATEDMEMMAAITPTDKPYMKTGVWETWNKRVPWLLLLMVSATFTGKIIQTYEDALGAYVVLTSFIPMLMGTGGNAGGQASTTIIRGLSLDEIRFRDIFRIIWKEIRVAVLCGVTLAVTNFAKLLLLDGISVPVATVVSLTLIVSVMVAKVVGCTLPLLAKRVGFDPAVMASPFITTIVDAMSLIIYFQFATAILGI